MSGQAADGPGAGVLRDVGLVAAWFAISGVVGALVWSAVTPLAAFTRTKGNAVMGAQELARIFDTSAWFFVIGAVGGLVGGIALTWWRSRTPVLTVVWVGLGGAFASWVMVVVGGAIGPGSPDKALATARVGQSIPVSLVAGAHAVWLVWPVAALVGAALVLLVTPARARRHPVESAHASQAPTG